MRPALLTTLTCLLLNTSFAYKYGEHKAIGDAAFLQFLRHRQPGDLSPIWSLLNLRLHSTDSTWILTDLMVTGGQPITYGVLNGLSGDHEKDPMDLEEQLRNRSSVMQAVIALHNQYLEMGYTAAPDGKLTKLDMNYAIAAALNLSHFYEYKKTFQQQLRRFDKSLIGKCEDPAQLTKAFDRLNKTNAINMYVTLHVLAMDIAEKAGRLARTQPEEARHWLLYALLFNGFADHFLEDAFSAGHLVVNRTVAASITNNKALHDFYCENGSVVVNRRGEIWKAYGDGQFNNTHHSWAQQHSLSAVQYTAWTPEAERIIDAVQSSLEDLQTAFDRAWGDEHYTPFLQTIPDNSSTITSSTYNSAGSTQTSISTKNTGNIKDRQAIFLITHIHSLELIPIPYNSKLETLLPANTVITAPMREANQLLPYRNFVRSRIANSFVISFISPSFTKEALKGFEFRANAGSFIKHYRYNAQGTKRGTLDYWSGFTLSYAVGEQGVTGQKVPHSYDFTRQVRAGLRGNADLWFTNRKFIGLYGYTEAGVQWVDHQASFIFVPSVGLQLGALLNINYYNMPAWLRIPAQYFLPLKLRYGAIVSPHTLPHYFSGVDLDIFF